MSPRASVDWHRRRIDSILRSCVADFELDTSGLVVYTEAASGPYLYNPILAALSGAETVYARTADSRYALKETVREKTRDAAEHWNVADRVEVVYEKRREDIEEADIVTNTGFVRPIDAEMVSWLNPTAVIPLMWETWEYREDDVDLGACQEEGTLVMGTDESQEPLDMYRYAGFLGMKLLFELGLEGHKTRPIILGGFEGLGEQIMCHFRNVGLEPAWFAPDGNAGAHPYDDLREFISSREGEYDAILVAEQRDTRMLIGEDGIVTGSLLREVNPSISVGVIAGRVDSSDLEANGIRYHPDEIAGPEHMSYSPGELGPRPPIELFAAGLKVGQTMANHRADGQDLATTAELTLKEAPAMAFDPPLFR